MTVVASGREAFPLSLQDPSARAGYVPSLDGLRALSILLVLAAHLISPKAAPGGLGVSVFFVISGFLIARLMFAEHKASGTVSLPRFYARRFLRLYPAALAYVAIITSVYLATNMAFHWGEVAAVLTYTANYYYLWLWAHHPADQIMPFVVFWSLAIEEHFYLLFPPLFIALAGRPRALVMAMIGVCVVELAARVGIAFADPRLIDREVFNYLTHFRLDAIAWGVLLAAMGETAGGQAWIRRLGHPAAFALGLLILVFVIVFRGEFFRETWRYSLQGFAILLFLCGLLFDGRYRLFQRLLNLPPLVWIGRLSYSIYVWHVCTPELAHWLRPGAGRGLQIVLAFALTFAFAAASYYLLERPIGRWRKRFGAVAENVSAIPAAA